MYDRVQRVATAAVIASCLFAGCSDTTGDEHFPQPTTVRSQAGVLRTELRCALTTSSLPDPAGGSGYVPLFTPTYNGRLTGPTLRIRPGDRMEIDVVNALPPDPGNQRTGHMSFPHDPYTTNLHTHGLTVCPNGISDNVLRRMPPQGDPAFQSSYPVVVDVPGYHPSGTFWYHPHKHGSVSFQFFGGMSGFLIIEGGPGTLDAVPEVAAAKERLMAFQVIRTDASGKVPFVAKDASTFSSGQDTVGLWSTFRDSRAWFTTNGRVNPTLRMQPGEVQRWRLLNAASGETLAVALEGHPLHVIANDGLTVPEMASLAPDRPYLMGAGNRVDLLVRAGEPGTYQLRAVDPTTPGSAVVYGTDAGGQPLEAAPRRARIGADFPSVTWPVVLATVVVEGEPIDPPMALPMTMLPVPAHLPSVEEMATAPLAAERTVAFEICGGQNQTPDTRLPSCGWYFAKYGDAYWGGAFENVLMMRDGDDQGVPNTDPTTMEDMPRVDYTTEGLFTHDQPLFSMTAGTFEEWTVENHTFSDHPFHIHVNPFLLTHVNDVELETPQWRDTILVPAATQESGGTTINEATPGSITFRTWFDPNFPGCFVMHCHILTHEDIGMMQELSLLDATGQPACDGCPPAPVPPPR